MIEMQALRLVNTDLVPEPAPQSAPRSEGSGIRRLPTADDLPDFTDLAEVDAPVVRRATIPPPVPPRADRALAPPQLPEVHQADDGYDDEVISLIDFDVVAKSCPPKVAGDYDDEDTTFPSVPGIPVGFHISVAPPAPSYRKRTSAKPAPPAQVIQKAPRAPFDIELALHVGVVWLSALAGGLLALL
jgi:hypothetical protein